MNPSTTRERPTPAALSRRSALLAGAAAGVGALALPEEATAALRTVRPRMAESLPQSFGVVVHPTWRTSVYGDHDRLLQWLEHLGVRHIRTRLAVQEDVLTFFQRAAKRGIRVTGVCGAFGDPQTMDSVMKTVASRFDRPERVFAAFEGINEPNNDGKPWIQETRTKIRDLHEARRKYDLQQIPILAPALARVDGGQYEGETTLEQAANLGDQTRWIDGGNMHVYPRGLPPSTDIDYFMECAQKVSGGLPITCTEGGYFTAPEYEGPSRWVPASVAAAYGPQKILEHMRAGNTRYFRYEFLNDPEDADRERLAAFGLLRTSDAKWKQKPEYRAMRRLLRLFSDPGPAFRTRSLTYSLTRRPSDLRHAVFQKRNGVHLLALWLDRPIWLPNQETLTVDDPRGVIDSVRVNLAEPRRASYSHVVSRHSKTELGVTTSFRVRLTPGVTVVRLRRP